MDEEERIVAALRYKQALNNFNIPKEGLFKTNYCEAGPRWNAAAFKSYSTNGSLALMMMAAMMMITPGFKLYNH